MPTWKGARKQQGQQETLKWAHAEIAALLRETGAVVKYHHERYLKELFQKQENFRKELSATSSGTTNEQSDLSDHGESRAQQGLQQQSELKETLQVKYNYWKPEESKTQQEIQDLDEEITQLQIRYLKGSLDDPSEI